MKFDRYECITYFVAETPGTFADLPPTKQRPAPTTKQIKAAEIRSGAFAFQVSGI